MDDGLLRTALSLQQSGNLAEAARLYSEIAAANPRSFDALCLLGMAQVQLGQHEDAQRVADEAVKLVSRSSRDLYNLGCLQQRLSRHEDALKSYEGALSSRADYFEALIHRGLSLMELKRYEDAVASFERALTFRPREPGAWLNRGNALISLARHDEALVSYEKALSFKADFADVWENRGHALIGLGRADEALASYDRAASLRPGHAQPLIVRGKALIALQRYEEALASFDSALMLEPENFEALFQRANALLYLGRPAEALPLLETCVTRSPNHVDAHVSHGAALAGLLHYEEALGCYDRALALKPACLEALVNRALAFNALRQPKDALSNADAALSLVPTEVGALLQRGNALSALMRYDDAIAAYDLCLGPRLYAFDPNAVAALSNRAGLLMLLKRFDEAIADYEALLRIDPLHPFARGSLLQCRQHSCDWRNLEAETTAIETDLRAGLRVVSPLQYVAMSRSPLDQLACTRAWVASEIPAAEPLWKGTRYGHERIRVAYLSEDFRDHPVARALAGVWEEHDRGRFETFAVSFGGDDGSEIRARIEQSFEHLIDISYLSDLEAARALKEREVDIVVDLMGYTGFCRPGILAHRPAPVQVNYLGFPGSMGADFVDYILADRTLIGEQDRKHYSENVVHLPDSSMAADRRRRIAEVRPTRVEAGLPDEGFVFCCFNNPSKFAPETFDIWMRLLKGVPKSVLWLSDPGPTATANLKREGEARGVAATRLIFAPFLPLAEDHLARLALADLFLDTWPYNAHATASDALWTGVPVLTLRGGTFAGRVAASVLAAIGLKDMIADSPDAYEAAALSLARDAQAIGALKMRLKTNRETHPLFDTPRFTRNLEKAYVEMRRRTERGEAPEHFSVSSAL